jgi:hypothetical protein
MTDYKYCCVVGSVRRGAPADFQSNLRGGFAGQVSNEAQRAAAVQGDHALMFGATFIFAPFLGDAGPAGGLAKDKLRRSLGFPGIKPVCCA